MQLYKLLCYGCYVNFPWEFQGIYKFSHGLQNRQTTDGQMTDGHNGLLNPASRMRVRDKYISKL